MSTKFTPGPWELIHFGGPQIGHKASGTAVCTMWGDEGDKNDPIDNNAHLIAAAPELYEALTEARTTLSILRTQVMVEENRGVDRWEGVADRLKERLDAIDAALAKARGEA